MRAALLSVLIVLAAAPAAYADHETASASVTLTVGDVIDAQGGHEGKVAWNFHCGASEVNLNDTRLVVYWRDIKGKERKQHDVEADPAQGQATIRLPAGADYIARASLHCETFVPSDDAGNGTIHQANATAASDVVKIAPYVRDFYFTGGEYCYRGEHLEVGSSVGGGIGVSLFPAALMRKPKSSAELRVRFEGGGLPRSVRPYDGPWRHRHLVEFPLKPKRAGTVKIWLEVRGVRSSNVLTQKVLPRRRNCTGY